MPSVKCSLMSVRRVTWRGSHKIKMRLNNLHIYTQVISLGLNLFIHWIPLFTCTCPKASLIYIAEKNTIEDRKLVSVDLMFHFNNFLFLLLLLKNKNGRFSSFGNRNMILHIYILAEGQLEGGNSCFHTSTPLDFNFSGIIKLNLN